MVKIRLTRLGKHKAPFYRIIATDSRVKRDGKYIALLGTYEPFAGKTKLKSDEIIKFLINGAQPTDTCLSMLKKEGIWAQYLKTKKESTTQKPAKKQTTKKTPRKSAKKSAGKAAKKATKKSTAAK